MENIAEMSSLNCSTVLSSIEYNTLTGAEQEQLLHLQQELLESMSRGGNASTMITEICKLAEQSLPNSVASVMLLDQSGLLNVYSAPSVPEAGVEQLNGLQPGEGGGSCGNAVFRKEPQFVEDTFNDPRWENMRQIAKDFNICSCWSMPIFSSDGNVLGSFALSSFEHRTPSNFYHKLLEIGASNIGIILEHNKSN